MQLHQQHKPEKNIGAFEARRKFGQLIEQAFYQHDAFVVERSGRPMAVIISVEQYQKLKRHARHDVMDLIREVWKKNEDVPPAELERDVEKAMEMLRQENLAHRTSSKSTL